jgi:cell division protein FtsQ
LKRKEYFGLSLSLVLVVALLTFINSNFFALDKVIIKGNKLLTNRQVLEFSKLNKGHNIFRLDFKKISSRLMDRPQIEGIILKRKFPSTVRVIIDEREPLVAIPIESNYLLISEEGWILSELNKMTDITYPILNGVKVEVRGDKIKLTKISRIVFRYLTETNPEFSDKVIKISVSKEDDITFDLNSSVVKFGLPVKIDYKISLLNQIYNDLKKEKEEFKYINLQYYDNPVIKLK